MILDRAIHKQAEIDIYQLHKTKVLRTYLNGKLVHENEKSIKEYLRSVGISSDNALR